MKKSVKVLAVMLCLAVFAAMAAGSGSSGSGEDKEIQKVETPDSVEETAAEMTDSEKKEGEDGKVSQAAIEEQLLYDGNGVKITATGMEDGLFGTELKLLIENSSDRNVTIQARNASVNDFMVDTILSADVAAGKKANDSLTFATSGLKECGIEEIAKMEFSFNITDSETWEDIAGTDMVTVETSVADGYVQEVDDSGDVLLEQDGIKIVGKGLSSDDSFWGPGLILYVENNSEQNITVQARDVSINGFMVESSMSEDVVAGKKAMSAVQFFSSDLEENSITDIQEVEFSFHIFNTESWGEIYDSDVIKLTF